MRQREHSTDSRIGKHLRRDDRIKIEVLSNRGHQPREIAEELGRHTRTIQREIQRGTVEHLRTDLTTAMVYNSDRAQDLHDLNATAKGPALKLGVNYDMGRYVSKQILKYKESPAVVANRMKEMDMAGRVCAKTLYSYVDQGLIPDVTNDDLWEKNKRGKRKWRGIKRMKKKYTERTCIEERPDVVETREEFGHWEIDLVVGGKHTDKPVLMTIVERKTRKVLIRKLPDKTQQSVLRALMGIERTMGVEAFRCTFKSITADNGSEFLDAERLQKSAFSNKMRTQFYYAHPYASWERGSNENANRMIRRFIAKGRNIADLTLKLVRSVEEWINNYPRKILDFRTAQECFNTAALP